MAAVAWRLLALRASSDSIKRAFTAWVWLMSLVRNFFFLGCCYRFDVCFISSARADFSSFFAPRRFILWMLSSRIVFCHPSISPTLLENPSMASSLAGADNQISK